jgi:hypothetical protein
MYEDVKKRYHFSSWSRTPRQGVSMLFQNFIPRRQDRLGWKEDATMKLVLPAGRRLTRSEWAAPRDDASRALVEIYETPSLADAQKCLLELLANNQLLRLPEGPGELGEISFVHPDGVPPAAFWVVGNLCISVAASGPKPAPVLDFAAEIQAGAVAKPRGPKRDLRVKPDTARLRANEETPLSLAVPRGMPDDVQYRYFATGGELFLKGDQVVVRALRRGAVAVEVFAVKARGKVHAARRKLQVA